jgi:hypothetical protein
MPNMEARLPLLALLLCACSEPPVSAEPVAGSPAGVQALREAPPAESDLPPMKQGSWSLACGAALELEPGGPLQLLEREGLRALGGQAVGTPAISADRARLAWSQAPQARPETVVSALSCEGGRWGEPRSLVEGPGAPDRVAISPDGAWVVWVSGASGVASLWAAPFAGGEAQQLTNLGVERSLAAPGQPPPGFVAPPHMGPPVIEVLGEGRYRVQWQAPDGEHALELP